MQETQLWSLIREDPTCHGAIKQQKILSLSIPSASHKRKESLCSEVRRYPSPQGHLSGAVSYRGPSFSGWGYRALEESLSEEKAGIWPLELSLPKV